MRLPPHLTASFQQAWKAAYGRELTADEANARGLSLLDFVAALVDSPGEPLRTIQMDETL